jgi:hypothetical protein
VNANFGIPNRYQPELLKVELNADNITYLRVNRIFGLKAVDEAYARDEMGNKILSKEGSAIKLSSL